MLRILITKPYTIQKMDEADKMYPNLTDETQCRLNKINDIKDYFFVLFLLLFYSLLFFIVAAFEYFDKSFI